RPARLAQRHAAAAGRGLPQAPGPDRMSLFAGSPLGATHLGNDSCRFCVWAPKARGVEVRLLGPRERRVPLQPQPGGYHEAVVEVMPVAQFPGGRNWGYDGVYPFAVQDSYGGPRGLQRLVDACHARGLAAVLDVVYNHLGPEGNYLAEYGPYFTDRYRTPWGA